MPIGVFLSLLAAVLLNAKIKGKSAFRAIYFLPMVVAPAAIAMVWKWIFNAEYGIINQIIGTKVSWLTTPGLVLPACAVVAIWSAVGYDAILLLSGIQNISKSYYDGPDQSRPDQRPVPDVSVLPGILCGREPGICFGHRDLDRGINRHYYGPAVLGTEKMG